MYATNIVRQNILLFDSKIERKGEGFMAESKVKGLWTRYMGTEVEEVSPVIAQPANKATPGVAAVQPLRPVAEHSEIENTLHYKMLEEAVLSKVSPFTSFLRTFKSFEGTISDSNQRLIVAVKALENVGGFTVAQINQAITMHLKDFDSAKKKFAASTSEQLAESVGALEKEYTEAIALIEQKKADITRIQEEITRMEARNTTLNANIAASKEKIEAGVKTFNSAAEYLDNMIKSYQQKLVSLPR